MRTLLSSASRTALDSGARSHAALTRRSTAPLPFTPLVLMAFVGCALPPPAEDKPLTGELEGDRERSTRVDSTSDAPVPMPEARIDSELDSEETSKVDVSSDSEAILDRVEGPEETVVESGDLADPGAAGERNGAGPVSDAAAGETEDPDAAPMPGAPASDDPTVADGQDDEPESPQPAPGEPSDVPEERIFETSDGLDMHYTIAGRGPLAVVFIHGWCGDAAQWQSHIGAVASRYHVLAVDLVGHGRSKDQLRDTWTIPAFAKDVAGLLEAEKLENVVLVGHTMGNQIGLMVAASENERVAAVVGVQAMHYLAGDPDPKETQEHLPEFRADYQAAMSAFVKARIDESTSSEIETRLTNDHVGTEPEVALSLMEHFGEFDVRPAFAGLDCRVVAINAARWKTEVEENRGVLPGFEVVQIENAGYWLHVESPEAFRQRLLEILKRLEPESTESALAELTTVLFTDDVATLARFYGTSLGFTELKRVPTELERPAVSISMERDGNRLEIRSLASAEVDMPGVEPASGGGVLALRVPVLATEKERLGEGAEIVSETGEEGAAGSGRKQVVVKDPVGNLIVLCERL